jgi:hypothetical protein
VDLGTSDTGLYGFFRDREVAKAKRYTLYVHRATGNVYPGSKPHSGDLDKYDRVVAEEVSREPITLVDRVPR